MTISVGHIVSYSLNEDLKEAIKNLAFYLSRHGVVSYLIILGDKQDVALDIHSDFLKAVYFQKQGLVDWGLLGKIKQELKAKKIDIVHSHDAEALFYGTMSGFWAGLKRVHTVHEKPIKKPSQFLLKLNHKVIVSLDFLKGWLASGHSQKAAQYILIQDGFVSCPVSVEPLLEERIKIRKQLGLKEDSLLVGNISALIPENDHTTLLKTFRKLGQKKVNVELILLGQGPLKAHLEKTALEYGIAGMIKFIPDQGLKEKLCSILDVYVLCSFKHNDVFQIIHAMAHGLPVIATKIFSRPEIIQEGKTGFLAPCGYPERIETAIMKLLVNPGLKKKMKEETIGCAKRFVIETTALAYLDVYKSLLKHPL
jgi:glycosyltransferase involved in cell wall biosynthesis